MAEVTKNIISRYDVNDTSGVESRVIPKQFGRNEDFIEVYVCDLNDNILTAVSDFRDYELSNVSEAGANGSSLLANELIIDPVSILTDMGYKN